ncbi:MAG: hypothetical protein AAGC78_12765 [Cellvibrio sp.]|uniref:hypothetical protein n=1 Tax=Cellvibrio sp. TaxID=1965322 RepID=UPI0031A52049
MIITKNFYRLATLALISALTTFTAPSWAIPLTFDFTGTISNTVLISKIQQTLATSHPQWNGLQVTGTVTMDLDESSASPYNGLGYSQYSTQEDIYPYADWMSFSVTNPDGSILDISDSIPITPEPDLEGNNAYTHLAHQSYLYGDSGFYAQRIYNNFVPYPRNSAALSLRAVDDNARWLTSSANYNDVIIKPEFANHDNYGWIYQLNDLGIGHEYYFRIDSLKRRPAEVPEPSIWLLFISSLLLIQMKRLKLSSYS